jgi:cyclopropane fatty-acyl-phospholipid synthase-like methyltransferase
MSDVKASYPKFSYDEHARTCAPDDFLGQARRTVRGVRLPDEQLEMIANAINSGLKLKAGDVLLELACGNGALTHHLFDSCGEYVGIDISEYLISIAKKNFEKTPRYRYVARGAVEYVRDESDPARFTRVLCYAGFQYLSAAEAAELLGSIHARFSGVERIFIGNLPDKDRAAEFYTNRKASAEELADCSTAIGVWRTQAEFAQLAGAAGWKVTFSKMPTAFHASYYRYDALLERGNRT